MVTAGQSPAAGCHLVHRNTEGTVTGKTDNRCIRAADLGTEN